MAQHTDHQTNKPVIFLAFAQDRVEGGAYLRNLPTELDGIRKALQKARRAGLCEIVERSSTIGREYRGFASRKITDYSRILMRCTSIKKSLPR